MAVRIKDGMIPYTWGIGIEITNNHVINVLLRELNNLIQVNDDRELYVDLQLADNILPNDTFPVGVTTGRILQENGRQQSWLIINWKTTSGDYTRIIYANDWKLYYDPWTWQWIQFLSTWDISDIIQQIENIIDVELDNYYTKQEVNELLQNIVGLKFLKLNSISDLPAVWSNGIIYLIPDSQDPTICDMYVWIDSTQQYEVIGTTAVDLDGYVTLATVQTITWAKTFAIEPVLPNKTADATNDWTRPATEAQVYKVAQSIPTAVSDLTNDLWFVTANAIGNGTIEIYQWSTKKWEFSTNQKTNTVITLDAWGGGWGGWASVSDTPYGPSWNGVTNVAPSKNAIYDKIESLGGQEVKVWNYTTSWFTQAQMQEISLWCMSENHSAIIKWRDQDATSPLNLYIFWNRYTDWDDVAHLMFYGMWEFNETEQWVNGDYTNRYNSMIEIQYDGNTYTLDTSNSHQFAGNYLTCEWVQYTNAFIPIYDYQPATKKYVDSRNRVGTQAQYDALVSGGQIVQWVIYNIISS